MNPKRPDFVFRRSPTASRILDKKLRSFFIGTASRILDAVVALYADGIGNFTPELEHS